MDTDSVTQMTGASALAPGPARDSILLGKYRVETVLGFGGAGVVIKARHLGLDEYVAIKLMRDDIEVDTEQMERFLREAKAAVRLKSEHVARIQDVGTFEDGKPYMIMELLEGMDLGRMIHDQDRVDPTLAVDFVLQACDALAEAHSIGIVHRDVKPTNLFVARRRDGSELVKVLDFGISKGAAGLDMSLTQTSSVLGTPAYMSPEQMRSARTVDARTDIWSLGTVLYEMVEGVLPFDANNFAELCVKVATEEPRPMEVAPQLGEVVGRCLAKTADERYANVAELAQALVPFASDQEQARRAVTKMSRMLGRANQWADPGSRPSNPRLDPSDVPAPRQSRLSSAIQTVYRPRKGSTAVTVVAFVGLIALGVAGGLWYALGRGGGSGHQRSASGSAAVVTPATVPGASDLGPRASGSDTETAAAGSAIGSDQAPDAITQAGVALPTPRDATVKRPKRPVVQQVVRPKRQPINAGSSDPPPAPPKPTPPPKPACNPFDAKDSC